MDECQGRIQDSVELELGCDDIPLAGRGSDCVHDGQS